MTTNQQMFLYAVEEMNFTRAAERAFVTQQCLSDHIRRLEKTYNVKLFDRAPRLKLTKAGEILYASLMEIQKIENHVEQTISENSRDVSGNISFGLHVERTHLIFPELFSAYHREYPNVKVSLISDQTPRLMSLLENGQLDMMLGLDVPPQEGYAKEKVLDEPAYLFATEKFLKRYIPEWQSGQTWISPGDLSRIPLSCTSYTCALTRHMGQFLTEQNVVVHYICEIGDYQTQLMLCRRHEVAFFCPESFLIERDFIESQKGPEDERVRALRVRGMKSRIRVEMVYSSHHYLPGYAVAFKDMLIEQYRTRVSETKHRYEELVSLAGQEIPPLSAENTDK